MVAVTSPNDSFTGIPVAITEGRGTHRIALPPDTGPPPAAQTGQWQPQTPIGEVARVAAQETVAYLRSRDSSPGPPPDRPRGWVAIVAVLGFTLGVLANAGIVVGAILHQTGNTEFEEKQTRQYDALAKELAAQREEMAAHRVAIYALIDVLAKTNPDVRDVERSFRP